MCVCVCVRACVCAFVRMSVLMISCACVFAMFCIQMFVNFHVFIRLYTIDLYNYGYLCTVCFSSSCKVL